MNRFFQDVSSLPTIDSVPTPDFDKLDSIEFIDQATPTTDVTQINNKGYHTIDKDHEQKVTAKIISSAGEDASKTISSKQQKTKVCKISLRDSIHMEVF